MQIDKINVKFNVIFPCQLAEQNCFQRCEYKQEYTSTKRNFTLCFLKN